MATATEDQMAELAQKMEELEAMVREVEAVSSVLEFSSNNLGSVVRGTLTTTSKGAAMLAQQVSDDLRKWRQNREDELVQMSRHHAHRLKQVVHTRKKIQDDRFKVREIVWSRLFDAAEEAMIDTVNELEYKIEAPPGTDVEQSLAPVAMSALRRRLEHIISPVEAMRLDPPPEMATASAIATYALERKRERVRLQQASLPGMATSLDADLLDVAERTLVQRKQAIAEQFEGQAMAIKAVKEALDERSEAFEELAASQRIGPPETPCEHWHALWPPDVGQRQDFPTCSSVQDRAAPQHSAAASAVQHRDGVQSLPHQADLDEQYAEGLHGILHRRGKALNDELCAEFQRRQSRLEKPSQQAREVQTELEMWKLGARQELLDVWRDSLKASHKVVVDTLKVGVGSAKSAAEQMRAAVDAGDEFNRCRNDVLNDVINTAEAQLASMIGKDMENFNAWRRRAELCALKRWTDIPSGIDDARYQAHTVALTHLGSIAQRLVSDCHVALPLPREEFKTTNRQLLPSAVLNLFDAWDRYHATISERLAFAEKVVLGTSDSVESCAVAKAALCLIDDEMLRIVRRLRDNPPVMSGLGKAAREERMRAVAHAG